MADHPGRTINRFDPTDTPESDPVPTGEDVVNRQKQGHETPRRYDEAMDDASERSRSEPRERSEPAKRLARERVRESEGQSPSE